MKYKKEFFLVSSMEKVLPDVAPAAIPSGTRLSTWPGAKAAVQLAYHMTGEDGVNMAQEIFSLEVEGAPCEAEIRQVQLVPVELPCQPGADDYFISKKPGLYPDLLLPLDNPYIRFMPDQYRSLWISWKLPEDAAPGDYEVRIRVKEHAGRFLSSGVIAPDPDSPVTEFTVILSVGKALLPVQRVYHCELFHSDCLADYYGVKVWSEEHWRIIENFMRSAQEHGIDEVMTPILTPPFDVSPSASRTTTQLVQITVTSEGDYLFSFEQLERWCAICKACGIRRLNITPWFSQWGATQTPKIVGLVNGQEQEIFGPQIPASDPSYKKFLNALIPQMRAKLAEFGYDDPNVTYRISDEPTPENKESYQFALSLMKDLLKGAVICESLSSTEFFKEGLTDYPSVQLQEVDTFIEAGAKELYCYYCVGQVDQVCNRFICMPNSRNRMMGVLLYLYKEIVGFAHWGFNFYNSCYSYYKINPFSSIKADWCFPAADAYLVYPGPGGEVWSSIRAEVQDDAYFDLRAMQLLESLSSREYVEQLIHQEAGMEKIDFLHYPHSDEFLLRLRERLAGEIDRRLPSAAEKR